MIQLKPRTLSIYAFLFSLAYFVLTIISPALPPALLFSALVAYFVYTISSNYIDNTKESFDNADMSNVECEQPNVDDMRTGISKFWVWGSTYQKSKDFLKNYKVRT